MQRHQKLGLAALAVFVFSHFLPAYHGESGFACFQVCWSSLLGDGEEVFSDGWFYYSGFAIMNIMFPVLVTALFASKRNRRFTVFVSVVAFLHVLSWSVLNVLEPAEFLRIQIGYYLWLAAFGGLVAANFIKAPNEAFGQTPVNHHARVAHG